MAETEKNFQGFPTSRAQSVMPSVPRGDNAPDTAGIRTGLSAETLNRAGAAAEKSAEMAETAAAAGETAVNGTNPVGWVKEGIAQTVEVLKDTEKQQNLVLKLAVALFAFFLVFIAPYCFVSSTIWEGLIAFARLGYAYVTELGETWDESRYSSYGTISQSYWDAFTDCTGMVASDMSEVITTVASGFTSDGSSRDIDAYSEADFSLMSSEEAMIEVYERKIDATRHKIKGRMTQIFNAVKGSKAVEEMFTNDFKAVKEAVKAGTLIIDGKQISRAAMSVSYKSVMVDLSKQECIKLMALYSTMTQKSPGTDELSAYMKWLGYPAGIEKAEIKINDDLSVFYGIPDTTVNLNGLTVTVPTWTGTFMPLYLEDEYSQTSDTTYTKRFGCSAIDLLLVVNPVYGDPVIKIKAVTEEIDVNDVEKVTIPALGISVDVITGTHKETVTTYSAEYTYIYTVHFYLRSVDDLAEAADLYNRGYRDAASEKNTVTFPDVLDWLHTAAQGGGG